VEKAMSETVYITAGQRPKSVPPWKATMILYTGVLYAPAATSPAGEQAAFLTAHLDGEEALLHECHPFLRLDWLEEKYPSWADVYQAMRRAAAAALTGAN
jgi:hypothetical protein